MSRVLKVISVNYFVSHLCYQNDCSCDNGSVVGHDKPFWHHLHNKLFYRIY